MPRTKSSSTETGPIPFSNESIALLQQGGPVDEWERQTYQMITELMLGTFACAQQQPELLYVMNDVTEFLRLFTKTKSIAAAMEKCPTRAISGRNSVLTILNSTSKSVSRSGIYKFITESLKIEDENDLRMCRGNMETIVNVSEVLRTKYEALTSYHRDFIKAKGE